MVFVKRNVHFCRQPFGYAVFDDTKFKEWIDSFMEMETARRAALLKKDLPVGASFLCDYVWTDVTESEAYALSTHICGGYNICIGNMPTIEQLKSDTEKYREMLNDGQN